MNYTKYIKKKEKIINARIEAFTKNINLSENFEIKSNFSENYKDDVLSIYLFNRDYKLVFYIYIDFIKFEVQKTKFEYFFYDNIFKSEFTSKGSQDYENLEGHDLNDKINSLVLGISHLWR